MKIFLNETKSKHGLYPFAATRHVADIRIGILTIREKWEHAGLFQLCESAAAADVELPANIIPTKTWMNNLITMGGKEVNLIANGDLQILNDPWQIFQLNDWALRKDFEMITAGRASQPIPATNKITGIANIFLEEGAVVEHSILNASAGPIYIGKNAQVMEGCMIRGGFALCEGAVLKMGSKIYGATTIGPHCNAAGEIKNAVMFGYSNKAHDGYLGDSVIGEWCNLGAGTTNSNVKNTAGDVKVWSNADNDYISVGLKCGLLMGDYSRSAINTSFNTGTVVGICCNIFVPHFPPKFISDFTWGEERYTFAKILQDIGNWKRLKGHSVTKKEEEILKHLYNQ